MLSSSLPLGCLRPPLALVGARCSPFLAPAGTAAASVATAASRATIQTRYASSKKGGSSARYLARQKNDIFVKARKQGHTRFGPGQAPDHDDIGEGFVSRSAFKLVQLDQRYHFLRPGRVIVDLGAAPGGWTQVIADRCKAARSSRRRVFALDLLPMLPVQGAITLQGNFLDPAVQQNLRDQVYCQARKGDQEQQSHTEHEGFVDVIVSDMMANTTGNTIADTEASLELCRAALEFASSTLKQNQAVSKGSRDGSVLVMKYFMSAEADRFRKEELEQRFAFVKAEKMEASRKESREQFWVCMGFRG